MIKQLTFLPIIIALIASCKSSNNNAPKPFYQVKNAADYSEVAKLTYESCLELNADSTTTSAITALDLFADKIHKRNYLSFLSPITQNIIIYDYDSKNLVKKIPLFSTGDNSTGRIVNPSMHKLLSLDTVAFFNYDHLFLLNGNGNKLKSVRLHSEPNRKLDPRTDLEPKASPGTYSPIISFANKAYILCGYNSLVENQTEVKDILQVNFDDKAKLNVFNRVPIYDYGYWGYNENLYKLYGTFNKYKTEIILSYPADPFIYSYNLKSARTKREGFVGSKYFKEIQPYLLDHNVSWKPSEKTMKESAEHEISNPSYYSILYDDLNKIYIRVAYLPRTSAEYNSPITRYKFKCTFILFNENFIKIGEQVISDAMSVDYRLMFMKDGYLHIFNKEKYNMNNRKLFFDKYKINFKHANI